VTLAWYSLEASEDHGTSNRDMATDKRSGLNGRKRILSTPCEIHFAIKPDDETEKEVRG